jgi:hypothetical protein
MQASWIKTRCFPGGSGGNTDDEEVDDEEETVDTGRWTEGSSGKADSVMIMSSSVEGCNWKEKSKETGAATEEDVMGKVEDEVTV